MKRLPSLAIFGIFLLLIVFLFVAADGIRIIQLPPRTTHLWRQSDCIAYTKTYYQRNSGFFEPSCYNLIGQGGRVVSEFPILYYLSAKLCRLFGYHYWIIRGVTSLVYLLGLFYVLLLSRQWIKNTILSFFPVVVLASTPVYFYYAINYLPNVPAISLSFAGLYHLLAWRRNGSWGQLVLSTLYFAVATLLKPTDGGLVWLAATATLLLERHDISLNNTWRKKLLLFCSAALIAAANIWWFMFVKEYDEYNHNGINLQGIYPIWELRQHSIIETFMSRIVESGRDVFQHYLLHLLMFFMIIVYFVKWKRLDRFLRVFTLWTIIGTWIYTPLWYAAFHIHDYYQLIYTVWITFLCITFLNYYTVHVLPKQKKVVVYITYLFWGALATVSIYHNQTIQLERYADKNMGVVNPAIYDIEPYLRKIGIKETDSVLSVPDNSPNITLAFYGNPGYTSDLFDVNKFGIGPAKAIGIHYMIILDDAHKHDPVYEPYTKKKLGEFGGIGVYDIR